MYLVILGFELELLGLELERLRDPDVLELDRLLDPDELELERLLVAASDNSTITKAMKTRIKIMVIRIVFVSAPLARCCIHV